MRKRILCVLMSIAVMVYICGCSKQNEPKQTCIKIAAAASLEKILTQSLIPLYQQTNPGIKIEGTYASSGKLQIQIEQGLAADIFISASNKQMDTLKAKGFISASKPLLKNELVLIVPKTSDNTLIKSFHDFPKAKQPAIGDPKSVPAGQYAKEALTSLQLWDNKLEQRLSLGTNVVEVLNWVAESSADAGLVYATDAASNSNVRIVSVAPEGSLKKPVIYPIGILKNAASNKEAMKFVEFLNSEAAQKVFREKGFKIAL